MIQRYVPYVLTVSPATDEIDLGGSDNLVFIGTMENNPYLRRLAKEGWFAPQKRSEGYSMRVEANPANPGRCIIAIQGADDPGTLYAAEDFNRYYIQDALKYHGYHYNRRYEPFIDPALPFQKSSYPTIEHRGLLSWGHVIYDYKGYIDNMSRLKLNTLIIWNDIVPLNGRDVVDYAHSRAVKVIWAYSWSWGQQVNPDDPADLEKWTQYAIDAYEKQYLPTGCDGIYFQAFTETEETTIGGKSISDLVIRWVNHICAALLARHPGLWLQFGLHATSIKGECGKFSSILPEVSILWEDAGSFPYHYDPRHIDTFEDTFEYTRKLLVLRGKQERFGAMLKGFTVLNWERFEHQKGPHIVGTANEYFMRGRKKEKDFYWRYAAPYWLEQAGQMKRFATLVAEAPVRDRVVTALVEDGLWESELHVSLALLSELLWDSSADTKELVKVLCHNDGEL
jgi:hypothetical protein